MLSKQRIHTYVFIRLMRYLCNHLDGLWPNVKAHAAFSLLRFVLLVTSYSVSVARSIGLVLNLRLSGRSLVAAWTLDILAHSLNRL